MVGLLAVMLALAGRLASGMVVADLGAGRDMAALLDAMVECQGDAPAPPVPDHPVYPADDHGLCVLASLLDLPAPTLAPAPVIPAPPAAFAVPTQRLLPVRGPPPHPPGAALPRGPPILT